jgi:toxin HigB-1
MEVRHDDDDLASAESDPGYEGDLDCVLLRAFRKVMNVIRSVTNETELYQWKGLRFEKLSGARCHQRSLRLNDQWRLIVEIEREPGQNNNVCVIKSIEDYHKRKK